MQIFPELVKLADGKLEHFTDDLFLHDRRSLSNMPVGSTWLWIVHKCGTHLARWDEDYYAGTKQSHLEALIRSSRYNWPDHTAALFTITGEGGEGYISAPVVLSSLASQLPRPKPKTGKPQQQVHSAAFALASL